MQTLMQFISMYSAEYLGRSSTQKSKSKLETMSGLGMVNVHSTDIFGFEGIQENATSVMDSNQFLFFF